MDEIFSLTLSEGAISNMLARAREPLLVAATTIRATVLASPVVCSDETSARVSGKNWWEWVFIGSLAVLHVIHPSRGKAVVQALFGEIRPMVWVSDMLGSQRGHAVEWQVCLAHLLRDATYAVECGDTAFSTAFKRLLLRAIAIGRRRDELKDITLSTILPTWIAGSTASWQPFRAVSRDASCASASPPTERTCSCSLPIGTCPIPTMSPSDISVPALFSAR
jgi:transposase